MAKSGHRRFIFQFCDVLGAPVSKLPGINLNIKTCALSLKALIDYFSFPTWLLQNNGNEDTSSLLPCNSHIPEKQRLRN